MIFGVGSTNPVKIKAVHSVVKRIWKDAKVVSADVDSFVSSQPMGEEETVKGAINRAKNILANTHADFGIGLEGGITKVKDKYYNMPWCAVIDKNGRIGLGCGGAMEIPAYIISEILKGKELGQVMDEQTGIKNTKQKMGAIGILTGGLINRQGAYEIMVIYALSKFIKPEFYK